MKKYFALLLTFTIILSLCACNGASLEDFPFKGTWANDEKTVFLRVLDDGQIKIDSVAKTSKKVTSNGVTTKKENKSIFTSNAKWKLEGKKFIMIINEKGSSFTPIEKDGTYSLVGEHVTYTRVGDLDYEIDLDKLTAIEPKQELKEVTSEEYTIGTPISAEGVEITFSEAGVKEDIRIASDTSGISITSGPSAEVGKKYVYLKGVIKNTGKTSLRPAIAGKIQLDDYEFDIESDIINTEGTPDFEVSPLDTVNILIYAKISDEMANTFKAGKLTFGFNDNFSDVLFEEAQYLYHVNVTR